MTEEQSPKYIGETEKNLARLSEGELDEWITTEDIAQYTGYNQEYIRRLLRTGKVHGKKWGREWMVDRDSFLKYMQDRDIRKPRSTR